jgi:[protein-PII] uridylyltransferase
LLLADVGTRRDLDDPDTIERVAVAIGSIPRLQRLAALTEADSLATGPSAWGPWKALLVGLLVERVAEFYVTTARRDSILWPPVVADLELVLEGRLALNARLTDRTRTYRRNRPPPSRRVAASVIFDNDISATATSTRLA